LHGEEGRHGKRGTGERPHGERHERNRVVVARDAVPPERIAAAAAMHERPLAVRTRGYRDGLHLTTTLGGTITRFMQVEMPTPQTDRTVIAMTCAGRGARNGEVAMRTRECAREVGRQWKVPLSARMRMNACASRRQDAPSADALTRERRQGTIGEAARLGVTSVYVYEAPLEPERRARTRPSRRREAAE
jgi:hypothetical protein